MTTAVRAGVARAGALRAGVARVAGLVLVALVAAGVGCRTATAERLDAAGSAKAASQEKAPRFARGRVVTPGGRTFAVEVVQDPEGRARGLQRRPALAPDQGMVFVFPVPGRHRFWMYDCLIPLDIIWIDAGKTVIHVAANLPICKQQPCPDYGPDQEALYVLELGAGVAKQAGIRPGIHLTILFDQPPQPR